MSPHRTSRLKPTVEASGTVGLRKHDPEPQRRLIILRFRDGISRRCGSGSCLCKPTVPDASTVGFNRDVRCGLMIKMNDKWDIIFLEF
jgi:hypothetical protein